MSAMSAIVGAANAKVSAIYDCWRRWHTELDGIKAPYDVYMQNYQMASNHFDNELQNFLRVQNNPHECFRRREAILHHAGRLKELEINYKQSVELMEREFSEQLEVAHKRLACALIGAFGDSLLDPWIQNKFRPALGYQTPLTNITEEERGEVPDPDAHFDENEQQENQIQSSDNQDQVEEASIETNVDLTGHQDPNFSPVEENPSMEHQTKPQNATLTEPRVFVPIDMPVQQESAAQTTGSLPEPASSQPTETGPTTQTNAMSSTNGSKVLAFLGETVTQPEVSGPRVNMTMNSGAALRQNQIQVLEGGQSSETIAASTISSREATTALGASGDQSADLCLGIGDIAQTNQPQRPEMGEYSGPNANLSKNTSEVPVSREATACHALDQFAEDGENSRPNRDQLPDTAPGISQTSEAATATSGSNSGQALVSDLESIVPQHTTAEPSAASKASVIEDQPSASVDEHGSHQRNSPPPQIPNSDSSLESSLGRPSRHSTKRPQQETADRPQKRPRASDISTDLAKGRVISFDKVYQKGNARVKYIITGHHRASEEWYILECVQHNKHFTTWDPIKSAVRHLASNLHGMGEDRSLAMEMFGRRVLNCTEWLAEKNNAIARHAFARGLGAPPPVSVLDKGRAENRENTTSPQQSSDSISLEKGLIPDVGEIYASRDPKSRHTYPVFILPWTSFDHFKWKKALLRLTPDCYLYNKKSDEFPRGWAEGYEDGGPLVSDRQYPVIYFDGKKFPDQSDVGWVPVSTLKEFDPNDTSIAHRALVEDFDDRDDDYRLVMTHCHHCALPTDYILITDDTDSEDEGRENDSELEDSSPKPDIGNKSTKANSNKRLAVGDSGQEDAPGHREDIRQHDEKQQGSQTENGKHSNNNATTDPPNSGPPRNIIPNAEDVSHHQVHNHTRGVVPQPRLPTLREATRPHIQAPFVSGDSEEIRPPTPETNVLPPLRYSDTGAVQKQGHTQEKNKYFRLLAPKITGSQPQPCVQPPRVPEGEDLVLLRAQARAALPTV
ncbi:hypothetical protein FPCIR_13067 [Fusarium pseudocircinatum]|uniref:Uncharacterized protein n=1 Tax=Fusarium pseudocircinatum TaxID=56676 RepID=A0A8H5NRR6_9HYPO|nr:hypothetical protein FPCIR_13067 [Fusarium pseudocircinatum]